MYFMRIRSKPGLDSLDVTNIDHLHTSFPKASLPSVPLGRILTEILTAIQDA